jgi:hypothetical protein
MAKLQISTGLIVAVLLLSGCGESSQSAVASISAPTAMLDGLAPGWNTIEPGGDTVCSDGTPYKFFVRPGSSDKLMVYFQGGGACWTGGTCDPDLKPTYYVNLEKADPDRYGGIFRFENPANPVKDYSVVYAPYCTADVHIGDAVTSYQAPEVEEHAPHQFEIQHKGFVNADAVLDWTYAHFAKPTAIFVAGSSAGSIPSPYYAMRIAEHYPGARIAQLGDASGGYRMEGSEARPHDRWGTVDRLKSVPGFEDIDNVNFDYARLYIAAAKQQPNIMFAQYDAAEDETQKYFLSIAGNEPPSLLSVIEANQVDIRNGVSNFRSYIAGGDLHTILVKPEFYAYHVDGTLVRDWVASLVNGEELSDVRCSDCTEAEVTEGFVSQQ